MKAELLESGFVKLTGISSAQLRQWRKSGERIPGVRWRRFRAASGRTLIAYDVRAWMDHIERQAAPNAAQHPLSTSADGIGSIPKGARHSD